MPGPYITSELLAQARDGQRDPLALAVRALLLKSLAKQRVPAHDAEDLCHEKISQLIGILLEGRVSPGKEDGYLWRCSESLAKSYYRKRKRAFAPVDYEQHAADPDTSEDIQKQENESEQRVSHLRSVLAGKSLTSSESQLLHEVYVLHLPIGQLVARELQQNPTVQRGPRKGEPRTAEQARNSIDQRLTRARLRLQEEMLRRRS